MRFWWATRRLYHAGERGRRGWVDLPLGLRYAVTGSVAGMLYGWPRLTHDVDIVLELGAAQVDDLVRDSPDDEFYCPPPEVIREEVHRRTRGHFNVVQHRTGFKADIYLLGTDPVLHWALAQAGRPNLGPA